MAYAISNPRHDMPVAWRFIASPEDAFDYEVVVDELPPDPVWNQNLETVVSASSDHVTMEERRAKLDELGAACRAEMEALFPGLGPWEVAALLAVGRSDVRLEPLRVLYAKFDRLRVQVDVANSDADLEAIRW